MNSFTFKVTDSATYWLTFVADDLKEATQMVENSPFAECMVEEHYLERDFELLSEGEES